MKDLYEPHEYPLHLSERIRKLSTKNVLEEGSYILYWMHHAVRAHHNPALDVAILASRQNQKPLLVYQGLGGNHPYNSDRHYAFIMQGAKDVQQQLNEKGIRYCFYLSENPSSKSPLTELASQASLVITEDYPAPPFPDWTTKLLESTSAPLWVVDSHCLVPMQLVGKSFQRAFSFRAAIKTEMQKRLLKGWTPLNETPLYYSKSIEYPTIDFKQESIHELCARCRIDHSVGPVHHTIGGSTAGYKRWNLFKEHGLATYHSLRNSPLVDFPKGVSRMSAYLHYGHVSPFKLAKDAFLNNSPGSEKYLDELVVWRELAFNLCLYNANVESIRVLPKWAQETLRKHVNDPRPALYSLETLEQGETEDDLWNAAQKSLVLHGELHNNVRMTWGKALLQWAQTPQEALDLLIHLNHKYALDGSDPNSYSGLLWCLGLFDRPFSPEQPIFGSVRTRSTDHHKKRLDLTSYQAKVHKSSRSTVLNAAIIGAGISGLSAARSLLANGLQVTVFEKSRGPGGRMATRRIDSKAFDHGAQYFTVRDARFHRQVESWIQSGIVSEWDGEIGTLLRGTYLPKDVPTVRYVGTPRMSSITRHLSKDIDIRYTTRVQRVNFASRKWQLADADSIDLGSYDALIVTTPPLQALPFLDQSPSLKLQVDKVNMLPCWAAMVSFAHSLEIPFDGLFVHENPLSWICRNSNKPGRPQQEAWILHASPDWSILHLEDEPNDILHNLLTNFFETTGLIPIEPTFATAHRWRYALAEHPLQTEHLWDAELRLAICGDWCNGSRVEGAYLSGIAAAGRVIGLPVEAPEIMADLQLSFPEL